LLLSAAVRGCETDEVGCDDGVVVIIEETSEEEKE
jgi:hypothetical protein